MRFVWVIVVLVAIGAIMSWTQDQAKEERKRLAAKPRSETYIAGNLDRGKAGAAAIIADNYSKAFQMFKLNKQRNPESLKELMDTGYIQPGNEKDSFGQPFELVYEENGKLAVISSPGADRVRGTGDDIVERFRVE
jgi:hypothetical protein